MTYVLNEYNRKKVDAYDSIISSPHEIEEFTNLSNTCC